MTASVLHILPMTIIQRERLLPITGRVVARKGQRVAPGEVVAEADLNIEHMVIDVARGMKTPPDKTDRLIQRRVNEEVGEGDILAEQTSGFSHKVMRAPHAGVIVAIRNGQVILAVGGRPFELKAGMPGDVLEFVEGQGVMIQTTGALIQGVWGNGRVETGLMNVQAKGPDDILTPDRLDISMRGSVVMGGYCDNPETFTSAGEIPLKGLILASMPSSMIPLAYKMRYPIILTEGFGRLAMNGAAFKLLSTNNRRETAINAETSSGQPPEIIIPLPLPENVPPLNDVNVYKNGQKVRMARAPYLGAVGTLTMLRPGLTTLESGLKAPAADVQLENGQKVIAPLVNLEILE